MVVNLAIIFFGLLVFSSYFQLSVTIFFFLRKKKKDFHFNLGYGRIFHNRDFADFASHLPSSIFHLPTSIFPLPTSDFSHGKPIQVQSIKKETKKHQKKFGYNDKELLSLHPAIGQDYNNNAQELE
jgi:hypothetical protein